MLQNKRKFEILSIQEDGGKTDCVSARQHVISFQPQLHYKIYISVNVDREVRIIKEHGVAHSELMILEKVDIDSLIEYLQDVKTFLSEDDLVRELTGKKYA